MMTRSDEIRQVVPHVFSSTFSAKGAIYVDIGLGIKKCVYGCASVGFFWIMPTCRFPWGGIGRQKSAHHSTNAYKWLYQCLNTHTHTCVYEDLGLQTVLHTKMIYIYIIDLFIFIYLHSDIHIYILIFTYENVNR